MYKKIKIHLMLLSIAVLLSGCSLFHIYRPTIVQGNILNDTAIAQLKPGMTANQVLYIMGTPLLTNTFEPQRWDYVYTYRKGSDPRYQRHVTLYFDNSNILQNIQVSPCQWVQ